jgi:hypothetical protein
VSKARFTARVIPSLLNEIDAAAPACKSTAVRLRGLKIDVSEPAS